MPLPPKLSQEIKELQNVLDLEVQEDELFVNLVLKGFPLGTGFNLVSADVLVRIPRSYPDTGPDMFWMSPAVLLSNGQEPQAANVRQQILGRQWQRFSWHRSRWDSLRDNMSTYIEFIRHRLEQKQ